LKLILREWLQKPFPFCFCVFGIPFFALPRLVWLPSTPYNLGVLQQAFYSNPKIVMVLRTAIEAEHG
jgi:hypothetical protein